MTTRISSPQFGVYRLEEFGGIPNDSSSGARTANNAAFAAIMTALPYVDGGSGAGSTGGGRIVFGPNNYYFGDTVTVTRPCAIYGDFAGNQQSKTKLYLPPGAPGMIFNGFAVSSTYAHEVQMHDVDIQVERTLATWAPTTTYASGVAVVPSKWGDFVMVSSGGTSGGSEPVWPENLQTPQNPDVVAGQTISDGSITWTAVQTPAIFAYVPSYLHNVMVRNAYGSGILYFGNTATSNVDLSTVDRAVLDGNLSHGMQVFGNDGNACRFSDVFALGNGCWGIFDGGFLGNAYYNADCSYNGTPPWLGGGYALAAITLGELVTPSIPNGYEFICTTAGTAGASEPAWTSTLGTTVTDGSVTWTCHRKYSGGPWNIDGSVYSSYAEGGQQPAVMSSVSSTAWLCDNGSGYLATQPGWVVANQTNVGPFVAKATSTDPTYDVAVNVGDVVKACFWLDFDVNHKDGSLYDAVQFLYNTSDGYFEVAVNNGGSVPMRIPMVNSPHGADGPVVFGSPSGLAFRTYGGELFVAGTRELNSAPTTGTWPTGSLVISNQPAVGSPWAYQCLSGGSPGTWTALYQGVETLLSSTVVDLANTNKQTLYTVPAGKSLIVTKIVSRSPSTTITTAGYGIGFDSGATNVCSAVSTPGDATTFAIAVPNGPPTIGVAADVLGLETTSTQAATVTVDVFGYLL